MPIDREQLRVDVENERARVKAEAERLAPKLAKKILDSDVRQIVAELIVNNGIEFKEYVHLLESDPPSWDAVSGELTYCGETIKRLSRKATNQRKILDAFEEQNWPRRTDDPLDPSTGVKGERLRETLRELRDGLRRISFNADGKGEGAIWFPLPK
ncbi:unnamed protein product [marine sediment metagenome]|uniref:Uncharacterized protein n=1 Tax=marine sediment metagenome TaxID=412755 RepID=X0RKG1_9ZZZZ